MSPGWEANADSIYTSSHVIGRAANLDRHSLKDPKAAPAGLAETARSRGWKADSGISIPALRPCGDDREADFSRKGCPMPMPDSFIAATARRHDPILPRATSGLHAPGPEGHEPAAGLP